MNRVLAFTTLINLMSSCNSLPQFYQAVEEMENDNAIKVEVQKEAMQKDTNLNILIEVTNSFKD